MSQMIEIVKPTSFVRAGDHPLAERPEDLGDLKVGFFHNNKPNADVLLERIEELFAQEDETLRFIRWGKPNPTLPEDRLEEFLEQVDVAVCAVGD
jgi:hypothetical protein